MCHPVPRAVYNRQHQRDERRRVDYHDLVLNVTSGLEPPEDVVDQVLRETGQTVEQPGRDVEVMVKRLQWRETLDTRGPLIRERDEIGRKIAKADKVLEEAERKHEEMVQPFVSRLFSIKQGLREADEAETHLRDTSLDKAVLAELADVTRRMNETSKRRSELEDEIRSLRSWSESDKAEAESTPFPGRAEELRERSEQRRKRADSLEPKLADAENALADLRKRESSLRQRLLLP